MDNKTIFLEKIPFVLLASVACLVSLVGQKGTGALAPLADFGGWPRLGNVLTGYVSYLKRFLLPLDLAPLYPLRASVPIWLATLCAALLTLTTWLALKTSKRAPFLLVGWLWFMISLLPVVGIVQVGVQATADRYTYLPCIGLYLSLAWGWHDFLWRGGTRWSRPTAIVLLGAAILSCTALAREQTARWKDTVTLFTHTAAVTHDNHVAQKLLGITYRDAGRHDLALEHFEEFTRLRPLKEEGYWLMGQALVSMGQPRQALSRVRSGLSQCPESVALYKLEGLIFYSLGDKKSALASFMNAQQYDPHDPETIRNLNVLRRELSEKSAPDGASVPQIGQAGGAPR